MKSRKASLGSLRDAFYLYMSEDFGTFKKGHIILQDHGDGVAFRNVKIRTIAGR